MTCSSGSINNYCCIRFIGLSSLKSWRLIIDKLTKGFQIINWRRISWSLASALMVVAFALGLYSYELKRQVESLEAQMLLSDQIVRDLQTELINKNRILNVVDAPDLRVVDLNGQETHSQEPVALRLCECGIYSHLHVRLRPDQPTAKDGRGFSFAEQRGASTACSSVIR